jgi:hypothetical protein
MRSWLWERARVARPAQLARPDVVETSTSLASPRRRTDDVTNVITVDGRVADMAVAVAAATVSSQ